MFEEIHSHTFIKLDGIKSFLSYEIPFSYCLSSVSFSPSQFCLSYYLLSLFSYQLLITHTSTVAISVRGRGRGRVYRRRQVSSYNPSPGLLGCPTVQTPRVPRYQGGLPTHMTDEEEKPTGSLCPERCGGDPLPLFLSLGVPMGL